jgi:predicted nuclease of predicted toxin-antitoxin system
VKLKIDENLPEEAAFAFREFGFDVETVADEDLSGTDDKTLTQHTKAESRVLVTLDLDFANVWVYPPNEHAGIIVMRLKVQDKETIVTYIRRLGLVLTQRSPIGELWIVERDRIRFRQSLRP